MYVRDANGWHDSEPEVWGSWLNSWEVHRGSDWTLLSTNRRSCIGWCGAIPCGILEFSRWYCVLYKTSVATLWGRIAWNSRAASICMQAIEFPFNNAKFMDRILPTTHACLDYHGANLSSVLLSMKHEIMVANLQNKNYNTSWCEMWGEWN